jgi:uncharacterized RDD family membrane protein YckC
LDCRRCGSHISDDAAYCSSCGQATAERAGQPQELRVEPQAVPQRPKPQFSYAGFWLRLFAYAIDILVLTIFAGTFILDPLMARAGISPQNPWVFLTNGSRQVWAINGLMMMAQWCYFALLESSAWQASLGKKLLGLYVTDAEGKRISFARATGRFFAMALLSPLTLGISDLMAAFTPRKQMLHDMMANCLVLKRTSRRL